VSVKAVPDGPSRCRPPLATPARSVISKKLTAVGALAQLFSAGADDGGFVWSNGRVGAMNWGGPGCFPVPGLTGFPITALVVGPTFRNATGLDS
jgi:hypothetical protein